MSDRSPGGQNGGAPPRRRRRWGRRIALALGVIVALPFVLFGIIIGLLYTETGSQWALERGLEMARERGEVDVRAEATEGSLLGGFSMRGVSVADREGIWLTAQHVAVEWHPWHLLEGRVRIEALEAQNVDVLRQPLPAEDAPAETEGGNPLAVLARVTILSLDLDRVRLAEPVLGEEMIFRAQGDVEGEGAEGVRAAFSAQRLDQPGEADVQLTFAPDGALILHAVVFEPEGGLLARLMDLPGLPAVSITVNGEGPADAWEGRMLAEAEGLVTIEADLALSVGQAVTGRASGVAQAGPNAPEPLRVLTAMEPVEFVVEGAQSEGTRRLDALSVAASTWSLAGEGRLEADQSLDATATLEIRDGTPFAELLEVPLGSARVQATFGGTVSEPTIAADVAVQETLVESLTARLEAAVDGAEIAFAVSGRLEGVAEVAPEIAPLAGEGVDVAVQGNFDREDQRVLVEALSVSARALRAEGEGTVMLDPLLVSGDLRATSEELSVFAPFLNIPLAGQGTLTVSVEEAGPDRTAGAITVALSDFGLGIPVADHLLAGDVQASTEAQFGPEGLRLDDFVLQAPGAALEGSFALRDMEILDGTFVLSVPELDRLPYDVQGGLMADGQVSGVLASPVITAAVRSESLVAAGVQVAQPRADLRLDAQQVALSNVSGSVAGAGVTGGMTIPFDSGLLIGEVRASVAREATLALPWLRLQGQADALATFGGAEGVQTIDFRLDGTEVALPDLGIAAQVMTAQAFLSNPFGDREGTAAVGFVGGEVSGLPFADMRITTTIGGQTLQVTQDIAGPSDMPYEASAGAVVDTAGAATTVRLDRLSVTGQGHEVTLASPTTIVLADGRTRIEQAQLTLDSGRVTASLEMGGGRIDAAVDATAVPLQVLELVRPEYPLRGTVNGSIRVSGPLGGSGPTGTINLTTSPMALPEAEITGLRLSAEGRIANGRLALTASFSGITNQPAAITADLPFVFGPSGVPTVPDDAPVSAAVNWNGPLQAIWALVPQVGHRVTGQGAIDARVGGTLAQPVLSGQASISNGSYENLEWGTVLRQIQLTADLTQEGSVRLSGTATDGGRGRVSLTGVLDNSGAGATALTADITLENATLIRADDLEATLGGQLAYRGSLDSGRLTGSLRTRTAEFALGERIGGGVATLNVVELDEEGQEIQQEAGGDFGSGVELEIAIEMPNQVFVRGEGLDSEWAGRLRIIGTLADPRIVGDIRVVRGTYGFLGQTFTFERGVIDFQGGDTINPALDISVTTDAQDITTIVAVTGTADAPKVALESRPPLPQDEILARTLFGTSVGDLSPGQALGIARAAARLTGVGGGGGLDILGAVRTSFGLDVLNIGTADGGPTVEAGKYLSEDVYVGVEQGTQAGSGSVNVEVELTPRVSVETRAGRDDTNVGIKWQFDY